MSSVPSVTHDWSLRPDSEVLSAYRTRFPPHFYQLLQYDPPRGGTFPNLLKYLKEINGDMKSSINHEIPTSDDAAGGQEDSHDVEMFPFYSNKHTFSNFNQNYPFKLVGGEGGEEMDVGFLEKWIMWGKALLFNDTETALRILKCTNPMDAKFMGRSVKNYVDEEWQKYKYMWLVQGLLYKMEAQPEFRDELLGPHGAFPVEAAPRDCQWGVGLGASNEGIRDMTNWRGTNILGFSLMETRHQWKRNAKRT